MHSDDDNDDATEEPQHFTPWTWAGYRNQSFVGPLSELGQECIDLSAELEAGDYDDPRTILTLSGKVTNLANRLGQMANITDRDLHIVSAAAGNGYFNHPSAMGPAKVTSTPTPPPAYEGPELTDADRDKLASEAEAFLKDL